MYYSFLSAERSECHLKKLGVVENCIRITLYHIKRWHCQNYKKICLWRKRRRRRKFLFLTACSIYYNLYTKHLLVCLTWWILTAGALTAHYRNSLYNFNIILRFNLHWFRLYLLTMTAKVSVWFSNLCRYLVSYCYFLH